ncbi:hypothetical protein C8R45DRAFT_923335 [Mycena sanguinolenta]|nr:hypothetical protein C8R45DRAFT_923335 [Mycena sanguinolenta]
MTVLGCGGKGMSKGLEEGWCLYHGFLPAQRPSSGTNGKASSAPAVFNHADHSRVGVRRHSRLLQIAEIGNKSWQEEVGEAVKVQGKAEGERTKQTPTNWGENLENTSNNPASVTKSCDSAVDVSTRRMRCAVLDGNVPHFHPTSVAATCKHFSNIRRLAFVQSQASTAGTSLPARARRPDTVPDAGKMRLSSAGGKDVTRFSEQQRHEGVVHSDGSTGVQSSRPM